MSEETGEEIVAHMDQTRAETAAMVAEARQALAEGEQQSAENAAAVSALMADTDALVAEATVWSGGKIARSCPIGRRCDMVC